MPAWSHLGPYDSDCVSLAREARVREIELLERRAEDMAALARNLELQAETTPDDRLADALRVLSSVAEEACARLIQETRQ